MEPVKISVQNLSSVCSNAAAEVTVKALASQAALDFNSSCWVTQGLAERIDSITLLDPHEPVPPDTWHMEILDTSDQQGAIGYHEEEGYTVFDHTVADSPAATALASAGRGDLLRPTKYPRKASPNSARGQRADAPHLPLMKVFAKTAQETNTSLPEVCSHELLEAAVDPHPMTNPRLVEDKAAGRVYIVEVGDPVQQSGYLINGVQVANFCLPAYYKLPQTTHPTQYDWCSRLKAPVPEMTSGGYLSWAPITNKEAWQQEFGSPAELMSAAMRGTSPADRDLLNRFGYHPPLDRDHVLAHEDMRSACYMAACEVNRLVPEGRERAIAITKLEEAMMWANAGIARIDVTSGTAVRR